MIFCAKLLRLSLSLFVPFSEFVYLAAHQASERSSRPDRLVSSSTGPNKLECVRGGQFCIIIVLGRIDKGKMRNIVAMGQDVGEFGKGAKFWSRTRQAVGRQKETGSYIHEKQSKRSRPLDSNYSLSLVVYPLELSLSIRDH